MLGVQRQLQTGGIDRTLFRVGNDGWIGIGGGFAGDGGGRQILLLHVQRHRITVDLQIVIRRAAGDGARLRDGGHGGGEVRLLVGGLGFNQRLLDSDGQLGRSSGLLGMGGARCSAEQEGGRQSGAKVFAGHMKVVPCSAA